jgi:hypothetical protein
VFEAFLSFAAHLDQHADVRNHTPDWNQLLVLPIAHEEFELIVEKVLDVDIMNELNAELRR